MFGFITGKGDAFRPSSSVQYNVANRPSTGAVVSTDFPNEISHGRATFGLNKLTEHVEIQNAKT